MYSFALTLHPPFARHSFSEGGIAASATAGSILALFQPNTRLRITYTITPANKI